MLPKKAHIFLFPLLQAVSGAVVAPTNVTSDEPAATTAISILPEIEQASKMVSGPNSPVLSIIKVFIREHQDPTDDGMNLPVVTTRHVAHHGDELHEDLVGTGVFPGLPSPVIITTTLTDTTSVTITGTTIVSGSPRTTTTSGIRTITRTQLSTQTSTLTTTTPTPSSSGTAGSSHRRFPVIVELLFGVLSFYAWMQLCLSIAFALLAMNIRKWYAGYRLEYRKEKLRMNMAMGCTEWVTPPIRKRHDIPMPEPFPRCSVPAHIKFKNIRKVNGKWVRRTPVPRMELDSEPNSSESWEIETEGSAMNWSTMAVPPSDSSFSEPGWRRSVDLGAMRIPAYGLEDRWADGFSGSSRRYSDESSSGRTSDEGSTGGYSDSSSTLYYSFSTRD